jgi:hypothetical protein
VISVIARALGGPEIDRARFADRTKIRTPLAGLINDRL